MRPSATLQELCDERRHFFLIHDIPPAARAACGLDSDSLCRKHPRLIVTSISAYGGFGLRAMIDAYEIMCRIRVNRYLIRAFPERPGCRCSNPTAITRNFRADSMPPRQRWPCCAIG